MILKKLAVTVALFSCITNCTKKVGKAPSPLADFNFTISNSTAPATVIFSNISRNATSYFWEFGDNETSALANPQHIYSDGGSYTIKLSAIGANQINSISKTITIDNSTPGKYFPVVKTIVQNNCLSCHSSSGAFSGRPTEFDTDSDIVAQFASIKAAVADPETYSNKRMPEGTSLSASDVDIIVKWFNKGGKATD